MMFLEPIFLSRLHSPKMIIGSKPPLTQPWSNYWESVSLAKTSSVQILNTLRLLNNLRVRTNLELRSKGTQPAPVSNQESWRCALMSLINATLYTIEHRSFTAAWKHVDLKGPLTHHRVITLHTSHHKLPLNFFHYFPATWTSVLWFYEMCSNLHFSYRINLYHYRLNAVAVQST